MNTTMRTAPWQSLVYAMLEADERTSKRILGRAAETGLSRVEICTEVITPAMHEVGRLWELAEISVVEEHVATTIARKAMDRIPVTRSTGPGTGRCAIVGSPEPSRHSLGARMLADALRDDGWDVVYVSTGVPTAAVVGFAALRRPDLVALSVGMPDHIAATRHTTEALHSLSCAPKVLVGGYGCDARTARQTGADAVALDLHAGRMVALELC